jgi:formylglycine-generating enzyme required for sulfatase activity
VPLPAPDRRLCIDMIAEGVRGPLLIVLPAGQFTMGSNDEKAAGPAHPVTISAPFAMSVYEVSVGDFRRFCDDTRRQCAMLPVGRDDAPVSGILWRDAIDYAAWLGATTGATYRLPTEAEWEYAARAGTTTRYPFGDDINQAQAAFSVAAPMERGKTVASNDFGLKHMVGNLREWVADAWSPGYAGAPVDGSATGGDGTVRVTRGGAYADSKGDVTSAARLPQDAIVGSEQTGFRMVREL